VQLTEKNLEKTQEKTGDKTPEKNTLQRIFCHETALRQL
jgi:hypothetical protein